MSDEERPSEIDGDRPAVEGAPRGGSDGPRDEFERGLASLWARVLDVESVGVHDHFLDLGGDSMSGVDLIQQMHASFGLAIPQVELIRGGTVAHCAALIRAGSRPDRGELVVPMNAKGSGPPLFLVHDITGEVLSYANLVRHLGTGRQVYCIQSRGFDGAEPTPIEPYRTIEEQAATYVDALRAARHDGPYLLAGYSHGGPVAYEMARQLSEAGSEVLLVVIIDAANYNPTPPLRWDARTLAGALRNVPYWIRDELLQMPWVEFRRRLQLRREQVARRGGEWLARLVGQTRAGRGPDGSRSPGSGEVKARIEAFIGASYDARRRYVPGPYPCRTVLIRGQAQPLSLPHRHDLGWGGLPGGELEMRVVPGGHNLLLPPFVARVARELSDCLRTIDPTRASGIGSGDPSSTH